MGRSFREYYDGRSWRMEFLEKGKTHFPSLSLSLSLARSVNYALGSIDKREKERALLKFSRRVSARNCER